PKYELRFARGWPDALRLAELTLPLARAIASAPSLRLLGHLEIDDTDEVEFDDLSVEEQTDAPDTRDGSFVLVPLARAARFGNLRTFRLGAPVNEDQEGCYCLTSGVVVDQLLRHAPRLEELRLFAHQVDTRAVFSLPTLTNLRLLQVYHADDYPLAALAAN